MTWPGFLRIAAWCSWGAAVFAGVVHRPDIGADQAALACFYWLVANRADAEDRPTTVVTVTVEDDPSED